MSDLLKRLEGRAPKIAIILGSSLGSFADAVKDPLRITYGDLKGFPVPKISGHAGELVVGNQLLHLRPPSSTHGRHNRQVESGKFIAVRIVRPEVVHIGLV